MCRLSGTDLEVSVYRCWGSASLTVTLVEHGGGNVFVHRGSLGRTVFLVVGVLLQCDVRYRYVRPVARLLGTWETRK